MYPKYQGTVCAGLDVDADSVSTVWECTLSGRRYALLMSTDLNELIAMVHLLDPNSSAGYSQHTKDKFVRDFRNGVLLQEGFLGNIDAPMVIFRLDTHKGSLLLELRF